MNPVFILKESTKLWFKIYLKYPIKFLKINIIKITYANFLILEAGNEN